MIAAALLWVVASGAPGFDPAGGFASNGYGAASPGGYGLGAAFAAEVVLTGAFLFVIMGATHGRAPVGFAPLAIVTWLYVVWSLAPVLIAVRIAFNSGKSRSAFQSPSWRWFSGCCDGAQRDRSRPAMR